MLSRGYTDHKPIVNFLGTYGCQSQHYWDEILNLSQTTPWIVQYFIFVQSGTAMGSRCTIARQGGTVPLETRASVGHIFVFLAIWIFLYILYFCIVHL